MVLKGYYKIKDYKIRGDCCDRIVSILDKNILTPVIFLAYSSFTTEVIIYLLKVNGIALW